MAAVVLYLDFNSFVAVELGNIIGKNRTFNLLKKQQIFLFIFFIINAFSFLTVSQIKESDYRISGNELALDSSESQPIADTLSITPVDTMDLVQDTTIVATEDEEMAIFDAEITYSAADSIVFSGSGLAFLYGDASIKYKTTELRANFIRLNLDSSMAYAIGRPDSAGVMTGNPEFIDGDQTYVSKELTYNFKTKKGYIKHVVTQQGEGYVTAIQTKKMPDNSFCMKNGQWTTCEYHDHPHFYINMSKAKVRPGKNIVTGPANLVMEGVPLPLFIPFGYFPFNSSYSSGFLMPTYGEESNRGFYLRDGGYYFAFSDYMDMAIRGDFFSKGSWGTKVSSNYKKRYKYSGAFSFNLISNQYGEKVLPDFYRTKDFSLVWSHRQDQKASPYSTFSASVNFSSSSYERNDMMSQYNPQRLASNQKRSSVSYTKTFPESPFSLSASANGSVNSSDSTIALRMPELNWSMSRIYPFKKKVSVGKASWYEKIGLTYSGTMSNSIAKIKEDKLMSSSLIKDWQNGIQHRIPLGTSIKVMKYFSLNPSVSYTERWYSSSIDKSWDNENSAVKIDTTYGFNRVWDYNTSLALTTKMYGFFTPMKALFGDKIEVIRHVMTPSVSLSYRPDFGQEKYGFYDTYESLNSKQQWVETTYSRYEGALYGTPGRGKSGALNFSLSNNVEMKVHSAQDTTGQLKKIKLLESLNFNASYNMAADSLKWSTIGVRGRTTLFKNFSINFGATFDPYVLDTIPGTTDYSVVRVNRSEWDKNRRIGRLTQANTSFGYSISNKTFAKKTKTKSVDDSEVQKSDDLDDGRSDYSVEDVEVEGSRDAKSKKNNYDSNGYLKFSIPWTLSFNYSMRVQQGKFNTDKMEYNYKPMQNLRINGTVKFTDKWDLNMSTGYDFEHEEFTSTSCSVTRNLHCWTMSANFVPFGTYKSYNFSIRVNSAMLADLKYDKRSSPSDNPGW